MNGFSELFWDASVEEMKQGYLHRAEDGEYVCLMCGETFETGVVYPSDGKWYDAAKFAAVHVEREHGSVFEFLLGQGKKMTGLTDLQRKLLHYIYYGYTDNEIVDAMDGGSTSTIRNHRFMLREKEKQAKVFLAIMSSIDGKSQKERKAEQMSRERRAKLKQEYLSTPKPMGIYQIRNVVSGKIFVGNSPNLTGKENSVMFQLRMGGHYNRELQQDYNQLGQENFVFEVVAQIKPRDEATQQEYLQELDEMLEMWLEELQPFGERGYNKKSK
ncbi:hypothetical protein CIG75_14930 [Tumebacillus algifaecis]|uniref:Uncharacterized protein n=1 Tax=Tumebacillus algifaecis TaxID=1214604 RepID=A0A223D3Q2_9BACL|nr:GIY-YIG nuclease family protein [Tumebacillus algifaecis]ASS76125.1 hypothetical protein CIG75_14930 [Tumebacillus algifaecis]